MKTAINDIRVFDGEKTLPGRWSVLFDESGILGVREERFEADRDEARHYNQDCRA